MSTTKGEVTTAFYNALRMAEREVVMKAGWDLGSVIIDFARSADDTAKRNLISDMHMIAQGWRTDMNPELPHPLEITPALLAEIFNIRTGEQAMKMPKDAEFASRVDVAREILGIPRHFRL